MDQASATARAATGTGWATFAGVFFLVAGTFQVIEGIAALSKSRYLVAQVLFANLEFWGVVLLIVGGLGIFAGYAILSRQEVGRVLGIALASLGIVVQLMFANTNVTWALVMIAVYMAILYGLIVKGEETGEYPPLSDAVASTSASTRASTSLPSSSMSSAARTSVPLASISSVLGARSNDVGRRVEDGRARGAGRPRADVGQVVPDEKQRPAVGDGRLGFGQDRAALVAGDVEVGEQHEVERACSRFKGDEIRLDPVDLHSRVRRSFAGLAQRLPREVDGRDLPATLGEPDGMAAGAAAEVECASRLEAFERGQHHWARLAVGVEPLVEPAAIPVARVHCCGQLSRTVTRSSTIGCNGCSVAASPSSSIRSTVSNPSVTSPTTAYSAGRPTSSPVTTKNWLPLVPGGSVCVFAIATTPRV